MNLSRPKFSAGFNFAHRVRKGFARALGPVEFSERSQDFKVGYKLGWEASPEIDSPETATNKLNIAWASVQGGVVL